jgi:hypothetical protein
MKLQCGASLQRPSTPSAVASDASSTMSRAANSLNFWMLGGFTPNTGIEV